jgi:poly-gamma-glutamate capsule biosynthesis protein CapA/YwtB (metallophosphatase superfamily)
MAPVPADSVGSSVTPSAPAVESSGLVLAAGGDVNLARECGQAILADASYDPFADLGQAWTSADLRFINLESQLSDQDGVTQHPYNRLIFSGPPQGAEVLSRAGISVVSLANNHAWDYGKGALFETLDNLARAQVPVVGAGRDVRAAYAPTVLRGKGLSVALFAVTHIWNRGVFSQHEGRDYVAWASVDNLRANVARARREHDFVLVSYHGGAEYLHAPIGQTERFAAAIMALGVDAFLGHHPHVPHGIGWFEGRPIVYSLGNFVFAGHDHRAWTKQSFFARLTLRKGAPPEVQACPIVIDGHRPRGHSPERGAAELARMQLHLSEMSAGLGGADVAEADAWGCLRVTPRAKPLAR